MSVTRIAVLAVTVLSASVAVAQADGEALKRAREAYLAGQVLYEQRKFAEAVAKFEEANSLAPRAGNLFNIGRCYEQLKEVPKALRAFREYLRLSPDAKEKREVEGAIGQLETQLRQRGVQQVAVRAEPEGKARVRVDDRDVGVAPVVLELTRGKHAFEVSAEGYSTARQDVTVSLERASDLSFTLERLGGAPFADAVGPGVTPPPLPPAEVGTAATKDLGVSVAAPRKPYVWAWVTTGLTVLGVAAGVVMGVLELGAQNDLKTALLPRTRADNQILADRATTLALGANIAYAAGGAAGLGSVLLFIFEGR
jgi:tetratricopeptide (TPR) repeat protein